MLTGLSCYENNTKDVYMMLLPNKEKLKLEQIYCNSLKGGSKEKNNDVFDDHISSADDASSNRAIYLQLGL